MSSERTISVQIEDDDGHRVTEHFNVDNIAYLRTYTRSLTLLTWLLIALGIVLTGLGGYLLAEFAVEPMQNMNVPMKISFAVVPVLTLLGTLVEYRRPDRITVGTVTANHRYLGPSLQSLENDFMDTSLEYQTLTNDLSSAFTNQQYRYHLVPDNMVRVGREHGRTIPVPLLLYVAAAVCAIIGATAYSVFQLVQVGVGIGVILAGLFAILGYIADPYRMPDRLRVELQSGETKRFVMTASDCQQFLQAFRERNHQE